ncbi:hypothetical protein GUITHDRAFT_152281 [Guillardia theta CCMP2712]|uniref:CUE domain-containing protein n=1 Tax=Guillardia theta (strain CCMP2712) TaxID=905079 RepID=L1JDN3_GUITC|nr:hypothetical protein GUITHDRAFT_152281 [Guillardia theta CCMP2712]EKX46648.1 hypothetical protein GUITHDRAFT_152281 [Guillardia theta CCMP2712]|eukprot:XP_005833628.1 hypothetical protein GUITHDRAFT_152281 [Guillardia theta CCMP2712]
MDVDCDRSSNGSVRISHGQAIKGRPHHSQADGAAQGGHNSVRKEYPSEEVKSPSAKGKGMQADARSSDMTSKGTGGPWLRKANKTSYNANEFSSLSDPKLWDSLCDEGEPVDNDSTVFRWRGKTLLHPFWSNGNLVVRAVPSGDLIYKGRPSNLNSPASDSSPTPSTLQSLKWGSYEVDMAEERNISELCSLFPGRLGATRARELLNVCNGDVNAAMAILLDEDCE